MNKALLKITAAYVALDVVIAFFLAGNPQALTSINQTLDGLYAALPNHAWSTGSSFPELARPLFTLSLPLIPAFSVLLDGYCYPSLLSKRYGPALKFFVLLLFPFIISIPILFFLFYSGGNLNSSVLSLGTSQISLVLFSWLPLTMWSLLIAIATSTVRRAFFTPDTTSKTLSSMGFGLFTQVFGSSSRVANHRLELERRLLEESKLFLDSAAPGDDVKTVATLDKIAEKYIHQIAALDNLLIEKMSNEDIESSIELLKDRLSQIPVEQHKTTSFLSLHGRMRELEHEYLLRDNQDYTIDQTLRSMSRRELKAKIKELKRSSVGATKLNLGPYTLSIPPEANYEREILRRERALFSKIALWLASFALVLFVFIFWLVT